MSVTIFIGFPISVAVRLINLLVLSHIFSCNTLETSLLVHVRNDIPEELTSFAHVGILCHKDP
jgi:hypothetical protein